MKDKNRDNFGGSSSGPGKSMAVGFSLEDWWSSKHISDQYGASNCSLLRVQFKIQVHSRILSYPAEIFQSEVTINFIQLVRWGLDEGNIKCHSHMFVA